MGFVRFVVDKCLEDPIPNENRNSQPNPTSSRCRDWFSISRDWILDFTNVTLNVSSRSINCDERLATAAVSADLRTSSLWALRLPFSAPASLPLKVTTLPSDVRRGGELLSRGMRELPWSRWQRGSEKPAGIRRSSSRLHRLQVRDSEPDADWDATIHLGGSARAFDQRMPAFIRRTDGRGHLQHHCLSAHILCRPPLAAWRPELTPSTRDRESLSRKRGGVDDERVWKRREARSATHSHSSVVSAHAANMKLSCQSNSCREQRSLERWPR